MMFLAPENLIDMIFRGVENSLLVFFFLVFSPVQLNLRKQRVIFTQKDL